MKPLAHLITLLYLVAMLPAQTASISAPTTKLPATKLTESLVLDWKELKPEAKPNGERRAAFNNPTGSLASFECHVSTLNPGEASGPAHTHDTAGIIEEALLLKEGTIEVQINDTRKTVGAGAVIYFAPKDLTAVKNVGKTPAIYFVVSAQAAPPPAAPAATK